MLMQDKEKSHIVCDTEKCNAITTTTTDRILVGLGCKSPKTECFYVCYEKGGKYPNSDSISTKMDDLYQKTNVEKILIPLSSVVRFMNVFQSLCIFILQDDLFWLCERPLLQKHFVAILEFLTQHILLSKTNILDDKKCKSSHISQIFATHTQFLQLCFAMLQKSFEKHPIQKRDGNENTSSDNATDEAGDTVEPNLLNSK